MQNAGINSRYPRRTKKPTIKDTTGPSNAATGKRAIYLYFIKSATK